MKICAVVVTFKRKQMLLECLNGLLNQTTKLDKIFVIDNNSSDGTEEEVKKLMEMSSIISYFNTGGNLGGAGGFYHGVKQGLEEGYDWLWLMDDDVEPLPDCLEKMLLFKNQSLCLHPTKRYTETGKIFKWQKLLDPKTGLSKRFGSEQFNGKDFTIVNTGCMEGMLIHKEIVDKIGLPDRRFFICGDDTMYGYLASKHTDVYYLRNPEFKKKIFKEEVSTLGPIKRPFQSPFYLYFNTRNHFLKNDYLRETGDGVSWQLNLAIFLKMIKLFIEVLFFFRTWNHFKMFYFGLIDGLKRDFTGQKRFLSS